MFKLTFVLIFIILFFIKILKENTDEARGTTKNKNKHFFDIS